MLNVVLMSAWRIIFCCTATGEGLEDGAFPLAGLFRDEPGRLYGTTVTNGLIQFAQGGNVFEIIP
jgi:hypothetical protein